MPSHYRGKPAETRALDCYIKLIRAALSTQSRLARRLESEGITEHQFGVLEALHHRGPMCQRDIGKKLLTSGGNVTLLVDNLEKRGLVKRVRGEEDRRYVMVHLTAAGRKTIEELFPGHVKSVVRLFGTLSADEQQQLAALCRKLGLGAQAVELP